MPSGARRRKAAKKKKGLEAHINPSSNTSQGKVDVKNRGDTISDSGQNQPCHSNPSGEGNKEIQESSSSNAGGLSKLETEQKGGLTSERNNGTVQNESVKGSGDDDRSTSSSSSDDDSIDSTKSPEVLDGKTDDLVAPAAASIVNSVTPEASASEETITIVESASAEHTAIPDMIASKKLETAPFRATDGITYVPVTSTEDQPSKPNEDRDLHLSAHTGSPESFQPESEYQPLIESRPPAPQRTSWLSCCGLCDVFTGSNR